MTYPELCSTCGKPYDGEPSFCSNPFHCCRDCTWVDGRRTFICEPCAARERRWKAEWAQRSSGDSDAS